MLFDPRLAKQLPKDLATIRDASARLGVDENTIRDWIKTGKGNSKQKRKLPTYRAPGEAEVTLVSLAQVQRWCDIQNKQPRTKAGTAESASMHLNPEVTAKLHEATRMVNRRLGMQVPMTFVLSLALDGLIKLEALRARDSI